MKRLFLVLALVGASCWGVSAQTINVYPTGPVAPRGTYQTITAYVQGVNDKTVTWTTSSGTLVGTNPCVANEPCTIALYTTTPGTYTVTATSNANHSLTATSTVTITGSPMITTGHPRLGGLNSSNLAAVQAKAVSGNMLYNSGIYNFGASYYTTWNAKMNWSDGGGVGNTKSGQPTSDQTDQDPENPAGTFAQLAVVDPSDATYKWGAYGHDLWLYQALMILMPLNTMYNSSTLGFRTNIASTGVVGDLGNISAPQFILTPDFLMGTPNGSGKWMSDGTGAALTATLTSGTMNTPTISSVGSGYTPNSIVYWFAPVATSGCASIGDYENGQGARKPTPGDNGTQMAAMGTVQTNSSGALASGTVTTLANALTCTTAPTIIVKSDKQIARDFFYVAGQQMSTPACCGTTAPIGGYNSSAQFDTGNDQDYTQQRTMGNNYTHAKIAYLVAVALTFDDNTTDDPALPNSCSATRYQVCPDGTAGSLHAYWTYLTGGMLYKDWMHIEDPAVAQAAYTAAYGALGSTTCEDDSSTTGSPVRISCFGDGRDGESSEGNWYQYSILREALACASMQSAGYLDPMAYGPQLSECTSSWWDMKMNNDLSALSYIWVDPGQGSHLFEFISTGDTLYLDRFPSDFNVNAWLMVLDADTGRTDRAATEEWPLIYTTVGGISNFYNNLNNDFSSVNNFPMFVALPSGDPTASPPSDPRLSMPTVTYSANNQHVSITSAYVSNGPTSPSYSGSSTQQRFDIQCQNSRIDHEHETCGAFDVLSNGEYITLKRTVFNDYNYMLSAAQNANELGASINQTQTACTLFASCNVGFPPSIQGIQLWVAQVYSPGIIVGYGSTYYKCTSGSACAATDVPGTAGDWTSTTALYGGGQLWHGLQAGMFTAYHSELPTYAGYTVDDTQAYNSSQSGPYPTVTGVTAASRTVLYLPGSNNVVTYDRAATPYAIRNWMNTTGAITFPSTCVAKWTTRSGGQDAYYSMLLPASGVTCSNAGAYLTLENGSTNTTDWEPYATVLEDAGAPGATQFLNVLGWGAHGYTRATTTLVQSSAGQNFDGALIGGSTLAMFMRSWPGSFTGVTYPASGATTQYVSNLTPNTTYTVAGTGAPSTCTADNAGVCTFAATGTGNITVGTSIPRAITSVGGVTIRGAEVQ